MNNFKKIFNPSEEDIKEKNERFNKIEQEAYDEHWCCTCKHFISAEDASKPVTVYNQCDIMGLAIDTCIFYKRRNS